MKKYVRKHLKDEKRILKLMYKKGVLQSLDIQIKDLGWECHLQGKRKRKRKNKRKYSYREYLPELHVFFQDSNGDGDSVSVISFFKEYLYWKTATDYSEDGFPDNGKDFNVKKIIKYLSELPTKINNSKFNKYLKTN